MDKLKAGFAQEIITPVPSEVFMDGYGNRITASEGIHDDIYVKACALRQGGRRFALVSLDVCGFNKITYDIVAGRIAAMNDLPVEKIALCATHTHASLACGVLADLPLNPMVWHRIGYLAGRTVRNAFDAAREGHFKTAIGEDLQSMYNRRGNKGFYDRRVKVFGFYCGGVLAGVIASASCHPVIRGDMQLSADYPGILTRDAAVRYPGVPFLFLQGRGADINPDTPGDLSTDEACEQVGCELRDSIFKALKTMDIQKHGGDELRSRYAEIKVPMRDFPDAISLKDAVGRLREHFYAAQDAYERRLSLRELIWHENALKQVQKGVKSNSLKVPLQIMTLSDTAAFVFIPFELLTRTGNTLEAMLLERGFSAESIMVAGYSNGTYGYLAPKEEWAQGGYEMKDAAHWYDLPECGDKSEDAVLNGIERLLAKG